MFRVYRGSDETLIHEADTYREAILWAFHNKDQWADSGPFVIHDENTRFLTPEEVERYQRTGDHREFCESD